MDLNRKCRGFIKGKLVMSLYKAAKPPCTPTAQYSNKVKPTNPAFTTSVGFRVDKKDFVVPASTKVSFVKSDGALAKKTYLDSTYGGVGDGLPGGDESVDMKAASYISCVQERFRLERVASERKNCQELQH